MAKRFEYTESRFLGLNLSSGGDSALKSGESPDMENFSITSAYKLQKRRGYKVLARVGALGRGIWWGVVGERSYTVFVADDTVYAYHNGASYALGTLESHEGEVTFLRFNSKLYILDGTRIMVWDGNTFSELNPYRPLVAISTTPDGAGVAFEEKNLLTGAMRQSFSVTEEKSSLKLVLSDLDSVDYVKAGGEVLAQDAYSYDLRKGTVSIECPASLLSIPDNVEVGFSKSDGREGEIHRFRRAIAFGGENDTRVFIYDSQGDEETLRWSGMMNGVSGMEYFPENAFTKVGTKGGISSVVRHYDRLMIFCRGETYYSYIEKATDEKGMEYSIFPIRPLSDSVGCESPGFAVLVDNFPVTLDRHSLYRWRSSSVRDERYAENIGERVRALLSGWDAALVRSFDSEKSSELFIRYGEHVLVYNYALDVFYLWRGLDACGFVSLDNGRILFLRADGALCALFESDTDDGEAVKAYWCTPYLELARGIKNLYSLSVTVSPDIDTAADIHWFSDHGESGSRSYSEEYRRFSFEKLNFARLGFMTGVCSRAFKLRLRHKRFEKLKLRFEDPYYSSTLHVLSFTASGLVTDKK